MSTEAKKGPTELRFEDEPIAWFANLLTALDRGEFQRAADSQEQLKRLGWTVRYKNPKLAGGRQRG